MYVFEYQGSNFIWVFLNTTMSDFIQFPPEPKHTVLLYVGDNLMNNKYTRKKKIPLELQYSFLALLLLPFLPIRTAVSEEEPRSSQLVRLVWHLFQESLTWVTLLWQTIREIGNRQEHELWNDPRRFEGWALSNGVKLISSKCETIFLRRRNAQADASWGADCCLKMGKSSRDVGDDWRGEMQPEHVRKYWWQSKESVVLERHGCVLHSCAGEVSHLRFVVSMLQKLNNGLYRLEGCSNVI